MKKVFTQEEVMEALQDFMSSEPEDGGITYYLHVNKHNCKISDAVSEFTISFASQLDSRAYENFPKDHDWRDDVEVESNSYFMEVVKDLTQQANDYFCD